MDLLREFEEEFFTSFVLKGFDYDSQFDAIRMLISSHQIAQLKNEEEIEDIKAFAAQADGRVANRAVDEYVDHLHNSVYQDAAYSLAAVGMLAPFIESVFKRAFPGIREFLQGAGLPTTANASHLRWTMTGRDPWDCQYTYFGKKDIVTGIAELSDAIGLSGDLPPDLSKTLSALFRYRNKMFHNGFEWPNEERRMFQKALHQEGWGAWFSMATHDNEPWVFYMTDDFITHCMKTAALTLKGMGAFVKRNFAEAGAR